MKKISLSLFCAGLITFASADMLSVSAGAGVEQQKISGYVKNGDTTNYFNNSSAQNDGNQHTGDLGLDNKNNPYVWIKLIHPIPILPNIKLQYTKYHTTGHSDYIAGGVKIFNDVNIPEGLINSNTKMDINSYDLTLFYEFNPIFADIELGGGVDTWQGETKINGFNNITHQEYNIDTKWYVPLPYLYGHIESMHIFGFSALATVKWAKAGSDHHYDYLGAVKYTFDTSGVINPFVKVGYRYKEVYGVDGDNTTKLQYKGVFAEIGAKF